MTTKAKKILITTESREVWIVRRRGGKSVHGFCPSCAKEVEFLTIDGAMTLARTGSRHIYRWIESGLVHFAETPDGNVLICPQSMSEIRRALAPSEEWGRSHQCLQTIVKED